MAIPNKKPLTVPASAEKEFPHVWIRSIKVAAPSQERGGLEIKTLPYNAETGEIADVHPTTLSSGELWRAVAEVPEVAQAMGAIFAAVPAFEAWLDKRTEDEQLG